MAVINSNHFTEGWQKDNAAKKVTDNLKDIREHLTNQDRASAKNTMDSLAQARASRTSESARPDSARTNTDVQKQAEEGSRRPETQDQSSRTQSQEQAFQRARSDARNLGELAHRGAQANGRATQEAVVSRNPAQDANLQQNANQQSAAFTLSQNVNQVPQQPVNPQVQQPVQQGPQVPNQQQTQRGTRPDNPQQSQFINEEPFVATDAAHQAAQTARSGLTPTAQQTDTSVVKRDGEGDKSEKKTKQSSSKSGGVYGAKATKDLDKLLEGGISADVGGGGSDDGAELTAAPAVVLNEIPAEDDSMIVFNEYDTSNPGIEMLLAKRNILENHVVKRLQEIQELDYRVASRINDIYATRSLSDRIVGDLKDELSSAKFHKSVYGGLIG